METPFDFFLVWQLAPVSTRSFLKPNTMQNLSWHFSGLKVFKVKDKKITILYTLYNRVFIYFTVSC